MYWLSEVKIRNHIMWLGVVRMMRSQSDMRDGEVPLPHFPSPKPWSNGIYCQTVLTSSTGLGSALGGNKSGWKVVYRDWSCCQATERPKLFKFSSQLLSAHRRRTWIQNVTVCIWWGGLFDRFSTVELVSACHIRTCYLRSRAHRGTADGCNQTQRLQRLQRRAQLNT